MSFDPHNPRGASRPPTPPSTPPIPTPPTTSKQPSYIPPQPVNRGPSRNVVIAIGAVIAVLLVGIVILLGLNMLKGAPATSPSSSVNAPPASHVAPTSVGSPGSSSVPSTPGSSASIPTFVPSVGPPPSAGTPGAALLGHIPDSIRPSCVLGESSDAQISARCVLANGILVTYAPYADANGMDADYEQVFARQQIDQDSGSCEDPTTWPAESGYDVEGQPAGRRLCVDADGLATIYWTDDRLLILSTASSASADAGALLEFWTNEAGPLP